MVIQISFVRVLHCDDYEEGLCCSLTANAKKTEVTAVNLMGGARVHVTCKGLNSPQKKLMHHNTQ